MAMVELAGAPVPVRASEGTQAQAEQIAAMVARDWTTSILGMTPTFRLEVAAPEDWPEVARPS
jgi:hypothetical protein